MYSESHVHETNDRNHVQTTKYKSAYTHYTHYKFSNSVSEYRCDTDFRNFQKEDHIGTELLIVISISELREILVSL